MIGDDAAWMKDLTDQERLMFQTEMGSRRKNPATGVVLALFLGGAGAHRFYLGQTGLGILYALFVWTFIPALVALIECFLMAGRVRGYNATVGQEIAIKLKGLRPGADTVTSASSIPASQSPSRALPATAGASTEAATSEAVATAQPAEDAENE